jgi:hypothetical protein
MPTTLRHPHWEELVGRASWTRERAQNALVLDVGVDLASLRFVRFGGGAFTVGTLGLILGGEPLSLRACGLFLCREPRLFGVSATDGSLIAVRFCGGAALVERLGPPPSRSQSHDGNHQDNHNDDGDDDESGGYEKWHPGSLSWFDGQPYRGTTRL